MRNIYVAMYVYKYSVDIYLLCLRKVRVRWCSVKIAITLGKLIDLLFCLHRLLLLFQIFYVRPKVNQAPKVVRPWPDWPDQSLRA